MRNRRKIDQKSLLNRAKILLDSGISVIPVYGDAAPAEPKRPAVKWRQYQKRRATEGELRGFFNGRACALGIVCGQVSGLVVVDFDDHLRYRRFCRHLPQYAGSYTVRTRRGFHVYFRTSRKVPTHQFEGGDIKGERSFVVAAPSVIGGFAYTVVKDCKPMELVKSDVDTLLDYFHVSSRSHVIQGRRIRDRHEVDVVGLYRRLAGDIGRNNALYRAASVARDGGRNMEAVLQLLLLPHVELGASAGHRFESYADRVQEARRTIASAYAAGSVSVRERDGIPNSVREQLLREQRSTLMPRFLESMSLERWRSESFFSLGEAIVLGRKYGLDRKSVMQVLTGDLSTFNGKHIIARRYVEYVDIRGLNRLRRGRPLELVFQVPSLGRLIEVLNVGWSPSDRLGASDVRSGHAYRIALHREYIGRLNPQASLRVLAGRLGVDPRTVRRYNRELGIVSASVIGRFRLGWEQLMSLPRRRRGEKRASTAGYWLESESGRRFPAWRHIGVNLLRAGAGAVHVCIKRPSVYSIGGDGARESRHEAIAADAFVKLRLLRDANPSGGGLMERLGDFMRRAKARAEKAGFESFALTYDSVERHIAEDKVAETIRGYLYCSDGEGREVRRPARRGIAYRMLKEFGNGNVFLALRSGYKEMLVSLAGYAAGAGDVDAGFGLLVPVLADV